MTVTDRRTISQVARDLRKVVCSLLALPEGSVFPANTNGSTPTHGPFATLLIVHDDQAPPYSEHMENDSETVIVEESSLTTVTTNIQIFRAGAYDRASLLARVLRNDHGARALRSIAVGTIEARAVDLSSALQDTLWEERALVVAKFSVLLQNTDVLPAIDSATAVVSLS